ncbi:cadherin-related family member 5 isoform X1 [Oenanthe melanoleuca]|uniref:cadherin-related family member 5 isoform X1 n=1 Tax=Oenanthe melanoleuca TaxID=2939378 RepID=UPI0024C1DAF2|nr:cadherin-related family member 5 isoform X1 [Oenanthe melanoleuca]
MAIPHWLLMSALFLLPLLAQVSAQELGCSLSNNQPSVPENQSPYVVTTIHVQPGFTLTIDPSSPDGQFFTIEDSELRLTKPVDYEVDPVLLLYLTCEGPAGQNSLLQIIVTVLNENDNSPVFAQPNLSRDVPEDTKVDTVIVAREELSASDADLDTIYYELTTTVQDTDGYFAIRGVNNPELYLQKALDYDKFNSTTLLLYARDMPMTSPDPSNTTHTATATITITIQQSDTRAPWFLPCTQLHNDKSVCISSPYSGRVNISEMSTQPLLLEPGPIYAVDPDYTISDRIVYSIVGGNTDEVFSVDADTGNLTMKKIVTSPDSFLLQVMATQVSNIRKYSVATVEIKVINKSNFPPYFEKEVYNGMVLVGLPQRSFVYQAGDPSTPLVITALDQDFPDKINPNIEYYLKNSTDFITTKDGLILTNTVLESPGTVTIQAVGKDVLSLEEASTIIVVEVILATAVTPSDKMYSAQDMAILGGVLAALLLIALLFIGVLLWKSSRWYGKPVKSLMKKRLSKEIYGGYQNEYYQEDVSTKQYETSETSSVQEETPVPEQPALALHSSSAEETESLPKGSIASTVIFDQEEEVGEKEEEAGQEKEVKSILKTDRHVADDGYKAVWFKTDVDPEAGERVEVIEDNAADDDDDDDDSDQDLQKNEEEEEEEGSDTDGHHRGLGESFASASSSPPAEEVTVNMSHTGAGTYDTEI